VPELQIRREPETKVETNLFFYSAEYNIWTPHVLLNATPPVCSILIDNVFALLEPAAHDAMTCKLESVMDNSYRAGRRVVKSFSISPV
jgi:hypothetical protein